MDKPLQRLLCFTSLELNPEGRLRRRKLDKEEERREHSVYWCQITSFRKEIKKKKKDHADYLEKVREGECKRGAFRWLNPL